MTVTLLGNSGKAVSAANGPTSLAPALSLASTAGNLLVMAVCCTGASPTITTPANWTQCLYVNNATNALAIFCWGNNPGGVTSTTVTLTAPTSGGACAAVFEFAGVGANSGGIVADNAAVSGTGLSTGTVGNINVTIQQQLDTLIVYASSRAASVNTVALDNFYPWSASQQAAVSTGSTTNAQLDFYWMECLSGPFPKMVSNYAGSVGYIAAYQRFNTLNTVKQAGCDVGGSCGLVTPFHQGMIGG